MPTKVAFLAVGSAIVLLPLLAWQVRWVSRVAPLAVLQIMCGIILGPSLLGQVAPASHASLFPRPVLGAIDGASTLGVVLYVFVTGLHLDLRSLGKAPGQLGCIAAGSILVPLIVGGGTGLWLLTTMPELVGSAGSAFGFTASVAICMSVTALPVLAAILQELELLPTRLGQTALALAGITDGVLWALIALVLISSGGALGFESLLPLAGAVLWFSGLVIAGRFLSMRPDTISEPVMVGAGAALAIVSAAVSEALGTGYIIGAFVAGVALPRELKASVAARLELPTAIILLPFFFVSTGLKASIQPGSASFVELTLIITAAAMLAKMAGTVGPARRLGFSWPESAALGAMLQTKGLMEIVVLTVLQEAGLIRVKLFSAMVAMAVLCTVSTAPIIRLCQRLGAARPQPVATSL